MINLPHQDCQPYAVGLLNVQSWFPLTGASSAPFLQEPPEQPQWFWFVLASSPIVIIIIILVIITLLLLLLLWFRSRQQASPGSSPTVPSPPISKESAQDSMPLPPPEESTALDSSPTIPSPTRQDDDRAKTEPSPMTPSTAVAPPVTVPEPQTMPYSGQRPANICWQIAGLTDVGLKRELNEDRLLMAEAATPEGTPYGLYVVADGLGGHHAGEIASQITIEAIHEQFAQISSPTNAPFDEWLKAAAMKANGAVMARQESLDQAKKMGSTVVMALVMAGQAHIANVGDSRAYLLTADTIEQISVDHSLVERLVQIGQLTREEARKHKNRNVIYNTIGDKEKMEVGLYQRPLQPAQRLLLCSDGLSGMLTDEQILKISQDQPHPAQACQKMVEAAKTAGGTDNITAIIVQMDE